MNLTFLTARIISIHKKVNNAEEIQIILRVPNIKNNKKLLFYQIEGYGHGKIVHEFTNVSVAGDFILVKGYIHIVSDPIDKRRKQLLMKIVDYQTICSNLYNNFE